MIMNQNCLILSIILLILQIGRIDSVLFKKCASPHGSITDVNVSGCSDNDKVCPLKRGTNASIDFDFIPTQKTDSVKVKIYGQLLNVPVPFPVNPSEACGNYGFTCPLEPETKQHFHLSLPILTHYPPVDVTININLLDDSKSKIACIKFKSKIN